MAVEQKLRIGLTVGDPGGVGPELVNAVLENQALWDSLQVEPVVFGHPDRPVYAGGPTLESGRAALDALEAAHRAIFEQKSIDALVTAPISKEAIHMAGCTAPGHTELLAAWCGLNPDDHVRMMLAIPALSVVLHSIHVPLRRAVEAVEPDSLATTFDILAQWGRAFARHRRRIAVCGLNPHAGENGHIGREDLDVIAPAIAAAAKAHPDFQFSGPWPADTVFSRAIHGDFDVVVAMYHDQGLIPVKTVDMHHGVNLTLGLPYIRTSPDHGTAFDRAGRGTADPRSFQTAITMAVDLARRKTAVSQ